MGDRYSLIYSHDAQTLSTAQIHFYQLVRLLHEGFQSSFLALLH